MKPIPLTDAMIEYIARYGGRCRECGDFDGVCPYSGLPCDDPKKAIRHVLVALNYGATNGFLKSRD